MEVPVFAEKLGNGKWVGTTYMLDKCPVCGGDETMMMTGRGMWACKDCKKGGNTLASLRVELKTNPVMNKFVESMVDPKRPDGMVVVSEYRSPFKDKLIGTGFGSLDRLIGGLSEGGMTVITGKRGEGKSTFLGQMALNTINDGHKVGFYSGELSAGRFQSWIFSQAAGAANMKAFQDQFGEPRWTVNPDAETKIRKWMGEKLTLYDNTKIKASERHTIVKLFSRARAYYGCDLFFVDNLMTARQDSDRESDALRAQANFAAEILDFARQNNVHVVLVAHPRKGESGDINDGVAGLSDITNMASNVIQVRKAKDSEQGFDSVITIAKNREHGDTGYSKFTFDKASKRFVPLSGDCIAQYGWNK